MSSSISFNRSVIIVVVVRVRGSSRFGRSIGGNSDVRGEGDIVGVVGVRESGSLGGFGRVGFSVGVGGVEDIVDIINIYFGLLWLLGRFIY